MIIKKLEIGQEKEFLDRCKEYLEWVTENTNPNYVWSLAEAKNELDYTLKNGIVYIAEQANHIIGSIAFAITPMFMSLEKIAHEKVWHCNKNLPIKTKYKVLVGLLEKANGWAIKNKVDRLIISANSKNPSVKILHKHGYLESETFYEKELNYGF